MKIQTEGNEASSCCDNPWCLSVNCHCKNAVAEGLY